MTKPTEDNSETPHQRVRKFYLPLIYGIATANFIAVIQLVSAPQLTVDWNRLVAGEEIQLQRFAGFLGMVVMTASVPILIGCALFHEVTSRRRMHLPKKSEKPRLLPWLVLPGIMGIPLTLVGFHPVFGASFFLGFLISAIGINVALTRFGRNDPTF